MVIFFDDFCFTSQSYKATVKVQLKDVKILKCYQEQLNLYERIDSESFYFVTMNIKQPRHDKI